VILAECIVQFCLVLSSVYVFIRRVFELVSRFVSLSRVTGFS
jgi:hypothetical protein